MPTDMKAKFFWAIIGDAQPEPVSVIVKDGKKLAFTLGCQDPFEVDGPNGIELLTMDDQARLRGVCREDGSLVPPPKPLTPEQLIKQRQRHDKWLAEEAARGVRHGWQRWNP